MILVAGATGYLGTEMCRQLRERGTSVRALVRPTSSSEKVDVVQAVERRTGRPMTVERIPTEALHAQRDQASDPMEHTIATLMLGYAQGDEIDPRPARELQVPIRAVRELLLR